MKATCQCKDPYCLGPDPERPSVLHRLPARLEAYDGPGGYVKAVVPSGSVHYLLPGRQVPHPFHIGDEGMLEFHVDHRSGLHYFVRDT